MSVLAKCPDFRERGPLSEPQKLQGQGSYSYNTRYVKSGCSRTEDEKRNMESVRTSKNQSKAWRILLLEDPTIESVLRAYDICTELRIHSLLNNKLIQDKSFKILEISMLLNTKGYLKDIEGGFKITTKGALYLIILEKSWPFWGSISSIIALLLLLLQAI